MLQGYTMAIVPYGNPTPKKLPTGGGEWPTFRTAHGTPPQLEYLRHAPHTTPRPLCPAPPQGGRSPLGDGCQMTAPHPPMGNRTTTEHAQVRAQKLHFKMKEYRQDCLTFTLMRDVAICITML